MSQERVLIIDDEPDILELLDITLSRMSLTVDTAASVSEALAKLNNHTYQLCLTDMRLPDGNGLDIVAHIQKNFPKLPVAMITAHGNMDTAIEALKTGAFDFLSKPIDLPLLRQLIDSALHSSRSIDTNASASIAPEILGETPALLTLKKQIVKLSRSQAPVFIHGESGTGKELVARAIHYNGPRSSGPFIPVNCGAIPSELIESEFFGHIKGSFTGASTNKQGLFQAAHGGTLFLDEIADLPLEMQVKLLRALQERKVRPIGGNDEIPVDIRVLSATHKDLNQEIAQQRFRSDLFYRVNVIELQVPALRQRIDDIKLLAEHILERISKELDLAPANLSKDALQALKSYNFPGNIRELENILERAFTLCENNVINRDDLSLGQSTAQPHTTSNTASKTMGLQPGDSLDDHLEEIEREILLDKLEQVRWNRTEAAKQLGISFRSIRYRLKKLGIDQD